MAREKPDRKEASSRPKPERRRAPTLQDVADRAGVSPSTVSAVLNDSPRARSFFPETKERVRVAAQELGYCPNPLAKTLKRNRSGVVGAVLFSQHSFYYGPPLWAAEKSAKELGYEIVTADMGYDPGRLPQCLQSLAAWRTEGLLLFTGGHRLAESEMRAIQDMGVPFVRAGTRRADEPCSSLVFNNFGAGRSLALHLAQLGHRRIGVIAANASNEQSEERVAGILAALKASGADLSPGRLIRVRDHDVGIGAGYRYTAEILELSPDLTALVCLNDGMAVGALRRLWELGRRVPKDISVTGFDDVWLGPEPSDENRLGPYLTPALTTIRAPLEMVGGEAMRMLVEMLRDDGARRVKRVVEFLPELVIRESTGPVPQG